MSRLRSIFFGTSEFAVPSLLALAQASDCVLVVTQPDRPAGRGQKLTPTPVKSAATRLGIATIEPTRLRDVRADIAAREADIFAVASYGKIVPQSILDLPRLGALNVHPSLLPLYRGATPLQTSLRDGVVESGVTIMMMDAGMDTGPIVAQEATPVSPTETYGTLHDRYAELGATLLGSAVEAASRGELRPRDQASLGVPAAQVERTLTKPLGKDDLAISWTWPATTIVNHVRSLSPRPAARAIVDGEPLKIVRASVASGASAGGFVMAAGDGSFVALERVIPPSRGEMSGVDYARMRDARVAGGPR